MTEEKIPESTSQIVEIPTPSPLIPKLEIDDDNFVDNGESLFHLSDVKNLQSGIGNQNNTQVYVIIVTFLGAQLPLPFADQDTRDAVLAEFKRRIKAIKNGTINSYISAQKKAREKGKAA